GQLAAVAVSPADACRRLLAEGLDDLVLQRDEELGRPGVPLAGATARELAVDPPRLVPLGPQDLQAPLLRDPRPQLDVGPAPGHVGRDRHATGLASLGDDLGL